MSLEDVVVDYLVPLLLISIDRKKGRTRRPTSAMNVAEGSSGKETWRSTRDFTPEKSYSSVQYAARNLPLGRLCFITL